LKLSFLNHTSKFASKWENEWDGLLAWLCLREIVKKWAAPSNSKKLLSGKVLLEGVDTGFEEAKAFPYAIYAHSR
jgi:hypothetical protein